MVRLTPLPAIFTDQPFWYQQKNVDTRIMRPLTYGIDFYGDCLFTSKQRVSDKPDEAKAFLKASIEGWNYAMSHPDEMIHLIKTKYKAVSSKERLTYEFQIMRDKIMLPELVDIRRRHYCLGVSS